MDTAAVYQKLKPYLKVCVLDNDIGYARRKTPGGRQFFHNSCTKDYLWGGYYAGIMWDHTPVTNNERHINLDRPTYEQFCVWYQLPLEPLEE